MSSENLTLPSWWNPRSTGLLFVVIALPFLLLSFANIPSADDFTYAIKTVESGYLKAQSIIYESWSGRYTSTALLTLLPGNLHTAWSYGVASIVNQILLFVSFWFFLSRWLPRYQVHIKWLPLALLTVLLCHFRGHGQGLYWLAGYVNYTLPVSLLLFLSGLYASSTVSAATRWVLTPLTLFIVIGGNEIIMFQIMVFLSILIAWDLWNRNPHSASHVLWWTVGLIGSFIVYLAPGNDVRSSRFEGDGVLFGLIGAFGVSFEHFINFLSLPLLFLLLILIGSVVFDHVQASRLPGRPSHVFWLTIAVFTVGFFPSYYSMGHQPQPRADNMLYVQFLILATYWALLTAQTHRTFWRSFFSKRPYITGPILVGLFATSSLAHFNYLRALSDVTKAPQFIAYAQQRLHVIHNSVGQDLIIQRPPVQILTTHFADIFSDAKKGDNQVFARFYGLKSVRLEDKE